MGVLFMKKKNIVATSVLAAVVAVSGQFVQTAPVDGGSFFGMQRAEAGLFSGVGDVFHKKGQEVADDAKGQAKDAVNKALGINFDGMNSRRNDMRNHLMLATGCFTASEYKIGLATDLAGDSNIQALGAIANNLLSGGGSMSDVYNATSTPRPSKELVQAKLAELTSSEDKEKVENAKKQMTWSKTDSAKAIFLCGLAARDASFLTKEAAKGLKDAKDLEDLKNQINEYKEAADEATQIIGFLKKSIKERNDARKAYDKANNIKEPSKKDVEASVASMQAE